MLAQAAYHKAEQPIVSKDGRTRIIIDFFDEAYEAYPTALLRNFDLKTSTQQPQVVALVQDYEKRYGFTRESMTTWVGASVTAFLTPQQVERLKADRNVRLLTEDQYATFSSTPPISGWDPLMVIDWWNGGQWTERRDWGHKAVNGRVTTATTTRKVYIIDSGVAYHDDLPAMQRVNVACGTGGDCTNVSVGGQIGFYSQVGCYAHATHVAGIIGATVNNGKNRMGVYPGVQMVSVGTTTNNPAGSPPWSSCGSANPTMSAIGAAFDYIYLQNLPFTGGDRPVNVATMSINFVGVGFVYGIAETNRPKLLKMVTPATLLSLWFGPLSYPGIFFTQSAGNQNDEACYLNGFGPVGSSGLVAAAFTTSPGATSTAVDGIMVVGAVKIDGQHAGPRFTAMEPRWLTQPGGSQFLTGDPGSNYGGCVDIWAPGDNTYSTWGKDVGSTLGNVTYSGQQTSWFNFNQNPSQAPNPTTVQGWQWLSGTSMAAPHVAAAAAYLADLNGLTSPIAIENAIRANWRYYGFVDPLGIPMMTLYLP